jgi:hypothetical protein
LLQFKLSNLEIKQILFVEKNVKTIQQIIRERKVLRVQCVYLLIATLQDEVDLVMKFSRLLIICWIVFKVTLQVLSNPAVLHCCILIQTIAK